MSDGNDSESRDGVLREIQKLEEAFREEVASRKRMVKSVRGVSALFCCTFIAFLLVNFVQVRTSWTEENFRESLEVEIHELSPLALRELHAMGRELLPVYANEGQKQLALMLPVISQTLERELDQLFEDILDVTQNRLIAGQDRVLKKLERVLFDSYPDLEDSAKRRELQDRFRKATQTAALAAISQFEELYTKDVESVRDLLVRFDVRNGEESTVDLQKRFLRLWLQLLDLEIKEL